MEKNFMWFRRGAGVALVAAMVTSAGCVAVAQGPTKPAGLEQKIEKASSRPDHEEIAAQYEQQAVADSAAAKRHQGYATTYRKNQGPRSGQQQSLTLAKHCDSLAQTYQRAADENLALAKLHREMAAGAK